MTVLVQELVTAGVTPTTAKASRTVAELAKAPGLQNLLNVTIATILLGFAVVNTQKTCPLLIVQTAMR